MATFITLVIISLCGNETPSQTDGDQCCKGWDARANECFARALCQLAIEDLMLSVASVE